MIESGRQDLVYKYLPVLGPQGSTDAASVSSASTGAAVHDSLSAAVQENTKRQGIQFGESLKRKKP